MIKLVLSTLFFIGLFINTQALSASKIYSSEDLAKLPRVSSYQFSPSGDQYLYIENDGKQVVVNVASVTTGKITIHQKHTIPEKADFYMVAWLTEKRLLFQVGFKTPKPKKGVRLREYDMQLYAVDIDGSKRVELSLPEAKIKRKKRRYGTTSIIAGLRKDKEHIILGQRLISKKGATVEKSIITALYKVNIYTGARALYTGVPSFPGIEVNSWYTDVYGQIRLGYGEDSDEKSVIFVKPTIKSKWKKLTDNDLFEDGKFAPLMFGKEETEFYVLSSLATGRKGLFHFDLKRGRLVKKIYEHKKVDLSDVIYSHKAGKLQAITYHDGKRRIKYYDEAYRKIRAEIANRIGQDEDIYIQDIDKTEGRYLILYANERVDGIYYHYNLKTKELTKVGNRMPHINPEHMGYTKAVSFMARDGVEVPAYVTYPSNYNKDKKYPLIVMPHGGPHVRDYVQWDTWVQFLSTRGYVVMQPNFRGSTGYGSRFKYLGFGQWGDDMQQDVEDSAKYLVRTGIADPSKMCIMGGSYGGYAALMGIIDNTKYFKCAIAWAPVADIKMILKQDNAYDTDHGWYWRVAGSRKKKHLKEISPLKRVKEFSKPLLLMHGDDDEIVNVAQSQVLNKAMVKAKKNVRYIEFKGTGHSLDEYKDRVMLFKEIDMFLKKYNPVH